MSRTADDILNNQSLAGPAQERLAAREMKQRTADYADDSADSADKNSEPRSLRQRMAMARRKLDVKQRVKDKVDEKVLAPARMGTTRALQLAWGALIPSWGLSLIWINIHVFLKMVFGEKLFCKLGDEWIPKKVQAAGGEAGKTVGRGFGIVEAMALALLDLIVFFVIFAVVVILVWLTQNVIVRILTTGAEVYEWGKSILF